MVTTNQYWYIGSDNLVELTDLLDEVEDVDVDDATITGQLKTAAGVNVGSSVSFNVDGLPSLAYGIVPAATTASLTEDAVYYFDVTIVTDTAQSVVRIARMAAYYRGRA